MNSNDSDCYNNHIDDNKISISDFTINATSYSREKTDDSNDNDNCLMVLNIKIEHLMMMTTIIISVYLIKLLIIITMVKQVIIITIN